MGSSSEAHSRRLRIALRNHMSELREAADRIGSALADDDEEELVADFKELRRRGKGASR